MSSYDPNSIPMLQQMVLNQVSGVVAYDVDGNRNLLKLYQAFPSQTDVDSIYYILSLALMRIPSRDFLELSYIISPRFMSLPRVKGLQTYSNLLETGYYSEFWALRESIKADEAFPIAKFDESIRNYILLNVSSTFRTVDSSILAPLLALPGSQEDLHKFIEDNSPVPVQISGTTVSFAVASVEGVKVAKDNGRMEEILVLLESVKQL
jgi:hypothetical protein